MRHNSSGLTSSHQHHSANAVQLSIFNTSKLTEVVQEKSSKEITKVLQHTSPKKKAEVLDTAGKPTYEETRNKLNLILGDGLSLRGEGRRYIDILTEVCNKMLSYKWKQYQKSQPSTGDINEEQVFQEVIDDLMKILNSYNKETNNFKYVFSKFPDYIKNSPNKLEVKSLLGKLINNIDKITNLSRSPIQPSKVTKNFYETDKDSDDE